MASFYIENFGCRATQADGAALERQFLDRGLDRAPAMRDAEIVVLNTCTVTEGADKDARASIRRLRRENPGCRILVTGCYAQRAPQELAALPGVTWVVGNSHKHQAAEIATARPGFVPLVQLSQRPDTGPESGDLPGNVFIGDIFAHTELVAAPVFDAANERTRPNLKVQDGCDNRCSFCVIPSVRGHSRSLPLERVIGEVQALVEAGYREVVISGINLGRWGRDLDPVVGRSSLVVRTSSFAIRKPDRLDLLRAGTEDEQSAAIGERRAANDERRTTNGGRPTTGGQRLPDLVRTILGETGLEKLRISSVEPMDWTDDLIELMATSPRIAKHAHVPLQSASDAVLRRMHRKYRPWHYREKILKIRAAMPTAAIGADVMVGFPGEREAEFAETREMIEELPFTYLHVFTYSARPGTPAAVLQGPVPVALARDRNRILREMAAGKQAAFRQSLVGTTVDAITLQGGGSTGTSECTSEYTEGLTDNYLKIRIRARLSANRWMKVRVDGTQGAVLTGSRVGGGDL